MENIRPASNALFRERLFELKGGTLMDNLEIIRNWKDEDFRKNLTPEQYAKLPKNPSGEVELSEADLNDVEGGTTPAIGVIASGIGLSLGIDNLILKTTGDNHPSDPNADNGIQVTY